MRCILVKGQSNHGTRFAYNFKVHFTLSGVRLSQAAGINELTMGYNDPRPPVLFATYDDPAEQERANPMLYSWGRGKDQRQRDPLARIREAEKKPEEVVVRQHGARGMDQTTPERSERPVPK